VKARWLSIIIGTEKMPDTPKEQSELLAFADSHHVLGQMAIVWEGKTEGKLREQLENGLLRSAFDHKMLHFEMDRVKRALVGTGISPILLKGAAYVANDLRACKGRRVSDIDILVSEDELARVEALLLDAGWAFDAATANTYDQAYYRKYMHELPPLRHTKRQRVLDVHHKFLPRTARYKIDNEALIAAAVPVEGGDFRSLNPVDLFIHAAIHAFADGAFDTPVRTLIELEYLFSDLTVEERESLSARAKEVGAAKVVGTALWALASMLENEQAGRVLESANMPLVGPLARWSIMKKSLTNNSIAKFYLYVRSHLLRMSVPQLMLHLSKKLVRRVQKSQSAQ